MTRTLDYQPLVLVETANLTREEWLAYRRQGIGGSDASAVLGISPFRTGCDLYYDKLGVVTADDAENWVAKEVGTLLEDLVARIFEKKTGLKVYRRACMFQHPHYPWMLADLDFLVELPDGSTAILECKTTNYNARGNWWLNGTEVVPMYYDAQGRHYMAVTNINRVYFCCLYGNNEEEAIIRHIDRDMTYEEELIFLEDDFWHNHVLAQVPPPYIEDGDLILESLRRHLGPAVKEAPPVEFTPPQSARIKRLLELQEEKRRYDAEGKAMESEIQRLKALIVAELGTSCTGFYEDVGGSYTVTYNPYQKVSILKNDLERLREAHPEIYAEYATVSEIRKFALKHTAPTAA